MGDKIIITAALTGGINMKGNGPGQTPHIPITADEMAADARRCYDAGATVIHLHSRNPDNGMFYVAGQGKENLEAYRQIVTKVRAACPKAIINISTGGSPGQTLEDRLMPVPELKPEMASYTPGALTFGMYSRTHQQFIYDVTQPLTFKDMKHFADTFAEHDTKPEIEAYCASMLNNIKIIETAFKAPIHFNIVMGLSGQCTPATPKNLARVYETAREMFPTGTCSVCAVGLGQWAVITQGAILGLENIRVGLEDNLYLKEGVLGTNAQMVEKAVMLAEGVGRQIATADEARQMLSLPIPRA